MAGSSVIGGDPGDSSLDDGVLSEEVGKLWLFTASSDDFLPAERHHLSGATSHLNSQLASSAEHFPEG